MLANVAVLCNAAALTSPANCERRTQEVLRRKLAVLLVTAVVLAMTLASGVALADPGYGKGGGKA
jgi:hypothetical protein